jgi:anti-sigma B factor antagonist
MDIAVEKFGAVTIATLHGDELDASNVQDFKRDVAPVLAENRNVILDLSHLRFIDSSGLGAMLSCLRQLNATGAELKLCGMAKAVRAVFELVRMHRIFDIYDTREQAVSSFQH